MLFSVPYLAVLPELQHPRKFGLIPFVFVYLECLVAICLADFYLFQGKCWFTSINKSRKQKSNSNIMWLYDFLLYIRYCFTPNTNPTLLHRDSIDYLMIYSLLILFEPGKFGAIFASVPFPIIAALYCVLFGYVCKFIHSR